MKYLIESNYPPFLYRKPNGRLAIAGRAPMKINGIAVFTTSDLEVPADTKFTDLQWVGLKKEITTTTYQVKGSKPGVVYTVSHRTLDGRSLWQCSCPGYALRGWCKHLELGHKLRMIQSAAIVNPVIDTRHQPLIGR